MTHTVVKPVMGTVVTIVVNVSNADLSETVGVVMQRLRDIEQRFTTYSVDSEVSRFGRGELSIHDVSDELRLILDVADKFADETDGVFNIYAAAENEPALSLQRSDLPDARAIEPSGVVKGWALQEVVNLLRERRVHDFQINLGGDVFVSGNAEQGEGWRIGLQHPFDATKTMAVLQVSDCAVVTSGDYERGRHIVGSGASELVSVSVVGPDAMVADVYATTVFAMGRDGLPWALSRDGYDFFIVDANEMTHQTPGLSRYLVN